MTQVEVRGRSTSSGLVSSSNKHFVWKQPAGLIVFHYKGLSLFTVTDRHDALFVVGSLDETLELRGLRYHPIDIETSVSRAHRSIAERSAS